MFDTDYLSEWPLEIQLFGSGNVFVDIVFYHLHSMNIVLRNGIVEFNSVFEQTSVVSYIL